MVTCAGICLASALNMAFLSLETPEPPQQARLVHLQLLVSSVNLVFPTWASRRQSQTAFHSSHLSGGLLWCKPKLFNSMSQLWRISPVTLLSFPLLYLLYKVYPMETDSSLVLTDIYKMAEQPTAVSSKSSLPQSHLLCISMRELKLALRMVVNTFRNRIIWGPTWEEIQLTYFPSTHTEFPHQSLDEFLGLVFILSWLHLQSTSKGHGTGASGQLSYWFWGIQTRPAGEGAPNPFEGDRGELEGRGTVQRHDGAEELLPRTKQTSLHISCTRIQHCPASKNQSYKDVMLAAF